MDNHYSIVWINRQCWSIFVIDDRTIRRRIPAFDCTCKPWCKKDCDGAKCECKKCARIVGGGECECRHCDPGMYVTGPFELM